MLNIVITYMDGGKSKIMDDPSTVAEKIRLSRTR